MKYREFLLIVFLHTLIWDNIFSNPPSFKESVTPNACNHKEENSLKHYCLATTAVCMHVASHFFCPWNPFNTCASLAVIAACQVKEEQEHIHSSEPSSIIITTLSKKDSL